MRFATLNAQNVIPYVYVAISVVWLVMLATAVTSLRQQQISRGAKVVWLLLIVLLPVLGLGLYCLRCLIRAEYPLLQQLGVFNNSRTMNELAKNP